MEAAVILPNQLFTDHPHILDNPVFLVEEDTYFTRYRFHKQKLILHRASLKAYEASLKSKVHYIENQKGRTLKSLFEALIAEGINKIQLTEVLDHCLEEQLKQYSKKYYIEIEVSGSPGFFTEPNYFKDFFDTHRFFMKSFYIEQRKRLKVLIQGKNPIGGKWSFDPENRKKLPKNIQIPEPWSPPINNHVKKATHYVLDNFGSNPGDHENFNHPVTPKDAMKRLCDFIENRLQFFGDYQDVITLRSNYVFHSLLSSSLNIGILSPYIILDKVLKAYNQDNIKLNNIEGFIRQLIGWREYMRAVYILKGRNMKNSNYWDHKKPIPESFYNASTGIKPLDLTLNKVNKTAYAHHIERLMILGNFSLLAGINPQDVFRWFMEMFIDSYEWVMVPNVIAMSQYADITVTTKPYISSSSYIRRMSDYKRGHWSDLWDALFWNYINENREKITEIPRMKVILYNYDQMSKEKKKTYREKAHAFLTKLS